MKKVPGMAVAYTEEETEALLKRIRRVCESGYFMWGDEQEELLSRWQQRSGRQHVVNGASETLLFEALLRKLGTGARKRVAFAANAFVSMVFAARRAGWDTTFVDIEPRTGVPSVQTVAAAGDIDMLVWQHTGGYLQGGMLDAVKGWCDDMGVVLIEDGAQAAGARTADDRVAGAWGRAALQSCSSTKPWHTAQGGLLLTDDEELASWVKHWKQYGRNGLFQQGEFVVEGTNAQSDEIRAAIGNVLLDTLDDRLLERASFAERYDALAGDSIQFLPVDGQPNWYKQIGLLPVKVDKAEVKARLAEEQVQLGSEVYDFQTSRLPVFQGEYDDLRLPGLDEWSKRHVAMPLHNVLTMEQVERAGKAIGDAVGALTPQAV